MKTGGTSVDRVLNKWSDIKPWPHRRKHESINDALSKVEDPDSFFKFTFVRNPWDRMVSKYFYEKKRGYLKEKKFYKRFKMPLTFNNYIKTFEGYKWRGTWFNASRRKAGAWGVHGRGDVPQYSWTKDKLDFVGKFETLQKDFNYVCEKIGVEKKRLPRINKTKHENYRTYYTDETERIIRKAFSKDVEYFEYEF